MNNDFNLQIYSILSTDFNLKSLQSRYIAPLGNNVDFKLEKYTPNQTNDFILKNYNDLENETGNLLKISFDNDSSFVVSIDLLAENISELIIDFQSDSSFINKIFTDLKLESDIESNFTVNIPKYILVSFEVDSILKTKIYGAKEIISDINYNNNSELNLAIKKVSSESSLIILSKDLELLAYLEDYEDFVWNRRWRKVDDFELSINKNKPVSRYLRTNNYVAMKKGDVVHAGRIANREIKLTGDGENITVSGKGLGEIFENRIAFHNVNTGNGYDSFSGSAESAMKHYVNVNVVDPEDIRRKVSKLVIATDNQKGGEISYNARFQKISEILYEIAKTSGLGWDLIIDLNTKQFIFKVLKAKIKTGVRLNPDMDSVKMVDFKESKSSSENTILIAGQGEGADRELLEISRNEV